MTIREDMSWIKFAYNTLVISLIFITPFVLYDVLFLLDKINYRTSNLQCDSSLTNYDYCPSVTHLNYMDLADKWLPIVNYIDKDRRATYERQKKGEDASSVFSLNCKSMKGRVFIIGDSFIQAEELRIEDRFEHYLRESCYEVHAFGFSSWNSVQFNSIIKSLDLKVNDHVLVFSMGNDYTPSYSSASVNTILNKDDESTKSDDRSLFQKYYDNSLIVNTYNRAKNVINHYYYNTWVQNNEMHNPVVISHNYQNYKDCSSIPSVDNLASNLTHDYIELSKHSSCWSLPISNSVNRNIELLKDSMRFAVEERGAVFTLMLTPAGWAFPNQNTITRSNSQYNIPIGIEVSQVGLKMRLSNFFPLVDLEAVLRPNAVQDDYLYFPGDGHWNENAHKIIGEYLLKYIEKTI
jgi:hypothetical protein